MRKKGMALVANLAHLVGRVLLYIARPFYLLLRKWLSKFFTRFPSLGVRLSYIVNSYKRHHARSFGRLHSHMLSRAGWYSRWHGWRHHHHVHHGTLAAFTLGMLVWIGAFGTTFASDLSKLWDFAVGGDYSTSSGAEIASSKGRLKVQNYANDANTMALYHLDENTGSSAGDSSSNANTGTITGGAWQTGNLNYSLTLNGSSTYISAADSASLSLTGANTIEAWTKFGSAFSANSHSGRQVIADKGSYQLYYDNQTGKVTYELEKTGQTDWTQKGGGSRTGGGSTNQSWDLNGKNMISGSAVLGSNLYIVTGGNTGDATAWMWDGTKWTKIGGDGLNGSWPGNSYADAWSITASGTMVYVGLGVNAGQAEVWRFNTSNNTWTQVGGDGLNSSWITSYEYVRSLVASGTTVYAGLGDTAGDAEVWRCTTCDTSPSWGGALIGGDAVNSSWANSTYERVGGLHINGTTLYAGLGITAGDAEVWSTPTGTISWTKIGGDALNSSWADTTFEIVDKIATDSSGNVYAGLGNVGAGDAEVWKYNGSTWTKIGGDALNSSWADSTYETVRSLIVDDSNNVYAGIGDNSGEGELWKYNGSTWTKIGGDTVNSSWDSTSYEQVRSLSIISNNLYAGIGVLNGGGVPGEVWKTDLTTISWSKIGGSGIYGSMPFSQLNQVDSLVSANGKLYAGTGSITTVGGAMVWEYDGSTWSMIGGQGLNSSWAIDTYERVFTMVDYGGQLYVGLGSTAGDAEVWRWNGSSWTLVGGDSVNSSWDTTHEEVDSLSVYNGNLYAGLGATANDAEVWKYNGSSWSQVGGDSLNSGWTTNYDQVVTMTVWNNQLVVGLGFTAGENEIWGWNGTVWSKLGGDGTATGGQSWGSTEGITITSLAVYNDALYVGTGSYTTIWTCSSSCTATTGWTKVGGDGVNSSWAGGTYEAGGYSSTVYNGRLYVGLGSSANDAEVWAYDGTTWAVVARGDLGVGWLANLETVFALAVHKGSLYAGTGNTSNNDALVFSYGNNAVLQSVATSQDTAWHHIAATYDGTTMKLYIDGTLNNSSVSSFAIPDGSNKLYVGYTGGSTGDDQPQSFFSGSIDELRISNVARSSFTTKPFSTGNETVQPVAAVYTSGVASWDSFADSETLNGGTINFRLSSDGGTTWKYWGGSSWATSTTLSQVNLASVINSNIATFPVTSSGLLWQAVMAGNGDQQVTLNSVTVTATSDALAPNNPGSVVAKDSVGGSTTLTTDNWYNYPAPYFSWSTPTDPPDGSGGVSGVAGYYVYFGTDNTADPFTAGAFQSAANYTAESLASGSSYYLRIKTKDNAGNVSGTTAALHTYKFDTTAPAVVDYVNVSPVGCSTSSTFNFTWPASSDADSGVSGYEYRLGSTGTVQPTAGLAVDAPAYQVGDNVFYVRAKDSAGNLSAYQTGIYCSTEVASVIDGPTVVAGPSSLTVSWTSSKATTSFVRVQEGNIYISEQGQSSFGISHSVKVVGLEPEKSYKYKLVWSDSSGNLGESSFFDTNTSTAPNVRNFSADILSPTSALLSWQTTELSSASIEYGIGSFGTSKSLGGLASTFSHRLTGLAANSNYQIRIAARTQDGYPYFYSITLQTPPFPSISNVRFDYLKEAQATIRATWTTNVASTSLIQYTAKGGGTKTVSSAELTTDHSLVITNLLDNTTYAIVAQSTDRYGNTGLSDTQEYKTPFDTRPPKISNLRVEVRSNGLGFTQKAQVVVSWETDEPSSSQIQYGPGIASNAYPSQSQEDASSSTNHVIIISELEPSRLYHLRAVSQDRAGNIGKSVDTTIITGKIQRSAIDLIIESLQRSLDFLRRLPLIGD